MSLADIARTAKRVRRLTEIATVATRHGLGHLVHRLRLQEHLPFLRRVSEGAVADGARVDEETIAERVCLTMQELGPAFVKLGQLLGARPDIIPESFAAEFRKLHDHVKPFDSALAEQIIEQELGASAESALASFDPQPFGSGSIAQVHYAQLRDGTSVVIKVKRPGIDKVITADISLLMALARQAESYFPEYRPVAIVEEFERSVRRELDLVTEASYTAKFHERFAGVPGVRAPRVFWRYTTTNVLTLERLRGSNIGDTEELDRRGIDRRALAQKVGNAFMEQFFRMGLFHADPHPGNLLVGDDGELGLIDFGMVGHLTPDLMSQLATTLIALVRGDLDLIVEIYADIGVFSERTDLRQVKRDMQEMLDIYYGLPLKRIETKKVFADVTRVARDNGIFLPRDFVLLAKSFITITNIARTLDPDFDVTGVVEPHAKRLLLERFSPPRLTKAAGSGLWRLVHFLRWAPREFRDLLRKVQTGSLQFQFKHQGLEDFMYEMDRASNRIAVSIILAAVIIGSSLVIHAGKAPLWGEVPAIGAVGYLFAGALGLVLVIAILRSKRL